MSEFLDLADTPITHLVAVVFTAMEQSSYKQYSNTGKLRIGRKWEASSNGVSYVTLKLSDFGISGRIGDYPNILAFTQAGSDNTNHDVYAISAKPHVNDQLITIFLNRAYTGGLIFVVALMVE